MNICFEKFFRDKYWKKNRAKFLGKIRQKFAIFFSGQILKKKNRAKFLGKMRQKFAIFFFREKSLNYNIFLGLWRCMQWIGNGHFAIFPRQTSRRTRFSLHESFGQILHHCPSRCASTGQNDWTWTQQVFRIIGQNRRIRSKPQYKIGTSAFFLTFFSLLIPYF